MQGSSAAVQVCDFRLDDGGISKSWVGDEQTGIGIRRYYLLEIRGVDCVVGYSNLVTLSCTVVGNAERRLGSHGVITSTRDAQMSVSGGRALSYGAH